MIHLYYCLQSVSLKTKKQKKPFRKPNPKKWSFLKHFEKLGHKTCEGLHL